MRLVVDQVVRNDVVAAIHSMKVNGSAKAIGKTTVMNMVVRDDVANRPGQSAGHRPEARVVAPPDRLEVVGPEVQIGQADRLGPRTDNLVLHDLVVRVVTVQPDRITAHLVEAAALHAAVFGVLHQERIAGRIRSIAVDVPGVLGNRIGIDSQRLGKRQALKMNVLHRLA